MARKNQYEIGVGVDSSGFEKGVSNGIVKPLDEAADAFDRLEKAADSADLDRELEKAQKATDKLDDELDDTRDALKRLGYAARDAGDDARRGMDRAEDGVKDFKQEAQQSAKEAAASFNGSATDIVDMFQEVSAQAFAGFGPAGVAAGLIAAAGIGIATQAFQDAEEAAEELRQKAVEYAQQASDAGVSTDVWVTSAARIVERIRELEEAKSKDWRWFWDEDPSQLQKWTDALEKMGRAGSEIGDVLSGDKADIEEYRDAIERSRDAIVDEIEALSLKGFAISDAERARASALEEELAGHQEVLDNLNDELKLRDAANESQNRQRVAGIDAAEQRAAAEEDAANRIQAAQDGVEESALSAYDSMRSAAFEKATADDAAFNTDKWLTYVEETRALADGYKANLATMQLSPAEWENFLALPEEARNSIAASYATAGEDGKARIQAALSDTGSAAGDEARVGFEDAFKPEASVTVDVDAADAADVLDEVTEDREVVVKANLTGEGAVREGLDELSTRRYVTVEARLDTSKLDAQMSSWRRSQESKAVIIPAKLQKEGSWD